MSRPWVPWLVAAAVMALALALRLQWIAATPTQPVSDFWWYVQRAQGLARGEGYHWQGRPTAYWPVGYPLFLSLLFGSGFGLRAALLTQALLGALAAGLTVGLAWSLVRSIWLAGLAGLVVAAMPSLVAYGSVLASEPLYIALQLGGLWALLGSRRWGWAITGGALIGLACLVRPQAVLLLPLGLLMGWIVAEDRRMGWSVLAACVALVGVLTPWTLRNHAVFGKWLFVSTNGGDNLLIGNGPGATGRYRNPEQCFLFRPNELSEPTRDRLATWFTVGWVSARGLPTDTWGRKLHETFGHAGDAAWWAFQVQQGAIVNPAGTRFRERFFAFRTYANDAQTWLLFLAGVGAPFLLLRHRSKALLPAGVIALQALLALAFFGNPRFGLPTIPFFAMAAAAPWAWALDALTARRGPGKTPLEPDPTASPTSRR